MNDKINSILEKIKVLKIELEPKIDLSIINNYENEHNIKFPETYVQYLTKIQNGHSDNINDKGPYWGIYSFEESLKKNKQWQIDINENFKLTDDIEMFHNKKLLKKYKDASTLFGTIPICEYGCGLFYRLIVNGNKYGEIIVDAGTIEGDGYYFMNVDILTFYENWLDWKIKYNGKLINAEPVPKLNKKVEKTRTTL